MRTFNFGIHARVDCLQTILWQNMYRERKTHIFTKRNSTMYRLEHKSVFRLQKECYHTLFFPRPQQSPVRLQCVRALQGLYQEKEFIGRLELFTSRFKVRHPSGLDSAHLILLVSLFSFSPLTVCLSQHLLLIYCFSFFYCFYFVVCLCLPSQYIVPPPCIFFPFEALFFSTIPVCCYGFILCLGICLGALIAANY